MAVARPSRIINDLDSPYYSPYFAVGVSLPVWSDVRSDRWVCCFCGSTNRYGDLKCDGCNAPKREIKIERQQDSDYCVWGVSTTYEEEIERLDSAIVEKKKQLGLAFIEPILRFTERFSRLWNGQ